MCLSDGLKREAEAAASLTSAESVNVGPSGFLLLCACPQRTTKVPAALIWGLQVSFSEQANWQIQSLPKREKDCSYILKPNPPDGSGRPPKMTLPLCALHCYFFCKENAIVHFRFIYTHILKRKGALGCLWVSRTLKDWTFSSFCSIRLASLGLIVVLSAGLSGTNTGFIGSALICLYMDFWMEEE